MVHSIFEEYGQLAFHPHPQHGTHTYLSVSPHTNQEEMAFLWDLELEGSLEDGKRLPLQKPWIFPN